MKPNNTNKHNEPATQKPELPTTNVNTNIFPHAGKELHTLIHLDTKLEIKDPATGASKLVPGLVVANSHSPYEKILVTSANSSNATSLEAMTLRDSEIPLPLRQQIVQRQSVPALEMLSHALSIHLFDHATSTLGQQFVMSLSTLRQAQTGHFHHYTLIFEDMLDDLKGSGEGFWSSLPKELVADLETLLEMTLEVTPEHCPIHVMGGPSAG